MENSVHYQYKTVSQAIEELKKMGYTHDFGSEQTLEKFNSGTWSPREFTIDAIYRYEGNTDPADQAIVYAIKSRYGLKGFVVSGYGASANSPILTYVKKMFTDR
jgi:hypothetical protein